MSSGTRHLNTSLWGISSAGRALAWHARGQRFDPAILHQKALYFVGSTVLFFLMKLVFGGCIASPAPFLGFCGRFLYNPQLLTLRFIHHPEVTARCSVRTVHIQGAMHPVYCFWILQYVKESLENHSKKCSKQKRNAVILT